MPSLKYAFKVAVIAILGIIALKLVAKRLPILAPLAAAV